MEDYRTELRNDYTYTIIIPHKNCPNLLRYCLNSIPYREDVQVIVVDDNSDVNKVDFTNFPGLNTPNTEVYFTKEGKGAGYARNVGLKYARGKWLLFADADDFFCCSFLSYLDEYKDSDDDIIFWGVTSVYPESGEQAIRHIGLERLLYKAFKTHNYDELRYKRYSPCAKMVSRLLVLSNDVFFDEVPVSNDVMFSVKTGCCAKRISIDKRVIYTITVRTGSLEYFASESSIRCRMKVAERVNSFLKNYNVINNRANIVSFILQFRKISYSLFVKELLTFIVKHPICFAFDSFDIMSIYIENRKLVDKKTKQTNRSYILLDKGK